MSSSKKIAKKPLRTAIRDLETGALRTLSHAELRLVAGGGSAGASTNNDGAGSSDDISSVLDM
jgi:hypothetical protein